MDPMTLRQASEACGGRILRGGADVPVHRVCTDSRGSRPNDLFVAIRGPRFDGHHFLSQARLGGASAALVDSSSPMEVPDGLALIEVEDTRASLGRLAGHWRRQIGPKCVVVAGSNGKTSTKEMLAAVLGRCGSTHSSLASYNNDIGVPLTLLGANHAHRFLVLEAGSNHPGELQPLLEMAAPDHGILTSIGHEHLEFFKDLEGVFSEESNLAWSLPQTGTLVVPGTLHGLDRIRQRARCTVITAGLDSSCEWAGRVTRMDWGGTEMVVAAPEARYSGVYRIPHLGAPQASNAMLVMALASRLGVDAESIRAGLASAPRAPWRMEPSDIGGLKVLNDAYNANPDSAAAALSVFKQLPIQGRRVAVFGVMGELGAQAPGCHAELGRRAAASGVEWLVAVGEGAQETARTAREEGMGRVEWVPGVQEASAVLREGLLAGDAVLLKGSRSARLERVAESLRDGTGGASIKQGFRE